MILSKRLQAVADMVTPGYVLADIGTDHGYVPIELVKRGSCPSAIAMDINEGPLRRAKEHIQEQCLSERIETRLSNGLEKLKPGEADAILIAGMGGPLIIRLIEEGMEQIKQAKELIISPHSEWALVRKSLVQWDLPIVEERMLCDEGKFYQIWRIVPGKSETTDREEAVKQADSRRVGTKTVDEAADSVHTKKRELWEQAKLAYGVLLLEKRDDCLYLYLQQENDKLNEISRHLEVHVKESAAAAESLKDIHNKLAVNETALRRYIVYEMQ